MRLGEGRATVPLPCYPATNESNLFKFLQQKQEDSMPWSGTTAVIFASPINRNSSTKLPGENQRIACHFNACVAQSRRRFQFARLSTEI